MVCVNTGKILEIGGGGGVGVVVAVWWCDFSEILEISLEKIFSEISLENWVSTECVFQRWYFSKMSYFSGESEIEFFRDIFDFFALRFSFTPTNRRRTPTPTTTPHRSMNRSKRRR